LLSKENEKNEMLSNEMEKNITIYKDYQNQKDNEMNEMRNQMNSEMDDMKHKFERRILGLEEKLKSNNEINRIDKYNSNNDSLGILNSVD
jgi:hypothetical protein